MRPIWNGTISFGLVNIPVGVFSATKSERVSFHFLHDKDMGRINNVRVCRVCEKVVPYEDLIRGYEYSKDEYVPITDEDFDKVAIETTKNISITDFVDQEEIDPIFFDKPYYLAPGKNAGHVYSLLLAALKKTNKVGIAKVAIRDREYLAAIKPHGRALMLDTMHFAEEIRQPDDLDLPSEDVKIGDKEVKMAEQLVNMMADKFEPEKYKDTYRDALMEMIDKKIKGVQIQAPPKRTAGATKVVDIMSKLKASLEASEKSGKKPATKTATKTTAAKTTAAARKKKVKAA